MDMSAESEDEVVADLNGNEGAACMPPPLHTPPASFVVMLLAAHPAGACLAATPVMEISAIGIPSESTIRRCT